MNTLTFNDVNFNPVERNGQIWLTSSEIAKALGYKSTKSVSNLYSSNSDEFTTLMTTVIESMTVRKTGNVMMSTRIFSLRGCHLLAMFARTDIAKKFRQWVLDILDKEVGNAVQVKTAKTISVAQQHSIRQLIAKKCKSASAHYQTVYTKLYERFGIPRYTELLLVDFDDAVQFIASVDLKEQSSPIHDFTHNQYIMGVKHDVMDYVYSLQRAIVNSGNKLPSYPKFDTEEICRSFMVSMIQSNRMMLSFDHNGKPNIVFVPQDHAVVSRESLSSVVQFADRSQLPSIINEAVERLGK